MKSQSELLRDLEKALNNSLRITAISKNALADVFWFGSSASNQRSPYLLGLAVRASAVVANPNKKANPLPILVLFD